MAEEEKKPKVKKDKDNPNVGRVQKTLTKLNLSPFAAFEAFCDI